jgi:hypothetical protein
VRCIRVNGAIAVQEQSFPQTGNWNTWGTTAAYDIALNAGANVVRVAFEQAQGSTGFLNLDELTVL